MMMLTSFIVLFAVFGVLRNANAEERSVDPNDNPCNRNLIPTDFPNTEEELRKICLDIKTYGKCVIGWRESYNLDVTFQVKVLNFLETACNEDNPTYKDTITERKNVRSKPSAEECRGDPDDNHCDKSLIPKDYPDTEEELRKSCRDFLTFAKCVLEWRESCNLDISPQLTSWVNFVETACNEDNPIYKVISSNLDCVTPIAREIDSVCDKNTFTKENYEALQVHENQFNDYNCVWPYWEVSCPSTVIGYHCGSKVKKAVKKIFIEKSFGKYQICKKKFPVKTKVLLEAYKTVVTAEQDIREATKALNKMF